MDSINQSQDDPSSEGRHTSSSVAQFLLLADHWLCRMTKDQLQELSEEILRRATDDGATSYPAGSNGQYGPRFIQVGGREIDCGRRTMLKNLLQFFLKNAGVFMSPEEIYVGAFGGTFNHVRHKATVAVSVGRLRSLLGDEKHVVLSCSGGKYALFPERMR